MLIRSAMSPRQEQILTAIVEHYAQTASPVGSFALAQKFGFSAATIRAEMAALEDLGYITHPHTSAGRIPTDRGYRHYVDGLEVKAEMVERKQREDRLERALEQRISSAGEPNQAVRSAVDSLVEVTHNLGIGTMGNNLYMSGLSQLFSQPEFAQTPQVHEVAKLLDDMDAWISELPLVDNRLNVFIGTESPIGKNSGCSLIISRFASPYSERSYIGVVGPTRQSYPQVMRLVERVGKTLEGVLNA